jgi:ATP-binding cassette subfamily F protein uup
VLDEPTNDLDIDTLTALEDLLDSWPGTLVVVSHDRYFVERVCDNVYAIADGGGLRHLPGGIDEYIELRHRASAPAPARSASGSAAPRPKPAPSALSGGERRAAQKEVARLERAMEKLTAREEELHAAMATHATDPARLHELGDEVAAVTAERDEVEAAWLEASEVLEG